MTQHTALTTILASLVLAPPAITHATEPSQADRHPTRCESTYRKKPVSPKQPQAIVESHGQWLEHREKPEYQRADLCQSLYIAGHHSLSAKANPFAKLSLGATRCARASDFVNQISPATSFNMSHPPPSSE
jgi:hypothetical protein